MNLYNRYFLIIIIILISSKFSLNLFAQEIDSTMLISNNSDSSRSCSHVMLKEVLLNSNPQDAYVFYNDSLIGNTPLFLLNNYDKLTLKKVGYEDLQISSNNILSNKTILMKFSGQEIKKDFFQKDIFKILTAGIVVLGGTTAYFKLKADNKFEEYEFSGNSKFLDDTRKYDLISGITFTALQINFGLLLYYFLIE